MAALLVLVTPAGAPHAPDHRFVALGYLTDNAGRPLADAPAVVTRVKTGLEYLSRALTPNEDTTRA